ncbi:hypothetical protein FBULB1_3470 [Fusarium bulbicola]|nr:hypothetical protein FBULB1_3470 [Fusarium bulbicola]
MARIMGAEEDGPDYSHKMYIKEMSRSMKSIQVKRPISMAHGANQQHKMPFQVVFAADQLMATQFWNAALYRKILFTLAFEVQLGVFLAVQNNADAVLLMDIGNGLKEGDSSNCDRERKMPFCEDSNIDPIEDESTPFRLTGHFLIGSNNPGSMERLLESQGHRFVGSRSVKSLVLKLGDRISHLRQPKMLRPLSVAWTMRHITLYDKSASQDFTGNL